MGKGKQFWGLKRRSTGTLPSIPDGGTWRNGRRSPSKGKETKGEGVTGGEELIEETRKDDKHYHFSYSYFYRGFCMAAMVVLMGDNNDVIDDNEDKDIYFGDDGDNMC